MPKKLILGNASILLNRGQFLFYFKLKFNSLKYLIKHFFDKCRNIEKPPSKVIKMVTAANLHIDTCLCLPPFMVLDQEKVETRVLDKIKLSCKCVNLMLISGHHNEIKDLKMVVETEHTLI